MSEETERQETLYNQAQYAVFQLFDAENRHALAALHGSISAGLRSLEVELNVSYPAVEVLDELIVWLEISNDWEDTLPSDVISKIAELRAAKGV